MFEITRTPTGVTWVRCRRCQASSAERSDARIAAWKLAHTTTRCAPKTDGEA